MFKDTFRGIIFAAFMLGVYGCGTAGVEVATYTEDKPRLDQNMQEGNAGFLVGTPEAEDRSQYKTTRKMYVLEVSKGAGEVAPADVPVASSIPSYGESYTSRSPESEGLGTILIPTAGQEAPQNFVDYKVEKDDTLQKISKKFYDSYSQWPRIYEVNRSVISNPDRLKPGVVIRVPVE